MRPGELTFLRNHSYAGTTLALSILKMSGADARHKPVGPLLLRPDIQKHNKLVCRTHFRSPKECGRGSALTADFRDLKQIIVSATAWVFVASIHPVTPRVTKNS